MLRLVLRSTQAHWRRFLLTVVAVVLGVSFVVGSFVLTDTLSASIDRLLADASGHTDFVVRAAVGNGGGSADIGDAGVLGGARGSVPSELLQKILAVRGVVAVDPTVIGEAALLDKAGNASDFDLTAISNWPDHPEMSAVRLLSGRTPSGSDDAVIDTTTASTRHLGLGSRLRIGTRRGVVVARVVGLAQRGSGNLGIAGQILAFRTDRATELVGVAGQVDSISVRIAPRLNKAELRRVIAGVAGTDASVLRADALLADTRQQVQLGLAQFNGLMFGFASLTLFVSAFLIWNTFSMVVAQRRRELALLRAVGASRRQVSLSVIGESTVVGLVASGLGLVFGVLIAYGLRTVLGLFHVTLPPGALVLAPRTVAVAVAVGMGVTLVSVVGPARRATRIPPVAALQDAAVPPTRGGRVGALVGVVGLVGGLALGAVGVLATGLTSGPRLGYIGAGGAFAVIGVTALARLLAAPIIGAIGVPLHYFGRVVSRLAIQNAIRDPRRTASTASALMIGLALVATTLVLGASVKTAFGGALRSSINADVIVDAGGLVPFGGPTLAKIAHADGVRKSVPLTRARATLAGIGDHSRVGITVGPVAALAQVVNPDFIAGTWPRDIRHVAVSKSFADEQKLQMGGHFTVHADNADRTFIIGGIYSRDELLDDAVAPTSAVDGLVGVENVTKVVLVTTTGRQAIAVASLGRAAANIPNSSARTADDFVTNETNALDLVLGIVNILLFFAVGVAAMGIANTLALSVVERTRELGLLRAVGMHQRDVRRMVRIEGVLVALLGGVLGLTIGVAFGSAAAAALPPATAQLTFPPARLALLFVIAGIVGVIAAALPARRAARLDVLTAIVDT